MVGAMICATAIVCVCWTATSLDVQVAPAERVEVKGETCRLSAQKPRSWSQGTKLRRLQHLGPGRGVPANGALDPASVVVRHAGRVLVRGKDYLLDPVWGSLGIGPEPSVTVQDAVTVDYRFSLRRLDSLVETADGKRVVRQGTSDLFVPVPPALEAGETRVANIFVNYHDDGTKPDVYPIQESPDQAVTGSTPGRIPKTMAKIKAGEPVKIVCWGDSVTVGGDASDRAKTAFAPVLARRLKRKFPTAAITVQRVAVGGSSSQCWLYPERFDATRTPQVAWCHWDRIEKAKPDLVAIEFVNDAGLADRKRFEPIYNDILKRIGALGAEIILITPHFTMPGMMGFKSLREPEKRGYVKCLLAFAEEHKLAVADASSRWGHLWKEGIPYVTLLRNGINHPDDRGHALFADELMKCFAD